MTEKTRHFLPNFKYIMSEKECLSRGGHVYEPEGSEGCFTDSEHPYHHVCKYCGHKQKGYYLPIVWEDC